MCRSQFDYLTKRLAGIGWQKRGHFVIAEAFNITCYNDGGSGGDPGVIPTPPENAAMGALYGAPLGTGAVRRRPGRFQP